MNDCIFCKIAQKKLPAKFIYEDSQIMVFPDIHPAAPLHLLIVPKSHIEDFLSPQMADGKIWSNLAKIVKDLVQKNKLTGYRLVLNGGDAKLINHLHLHLMGDVGAERKL